MSPDQLLIVILRDGLIRMFPIVDAFCVAILLRHTKSWHIVSPMLFHLENFGLKVTAGVIIHNQQSDPGL